MRASFVLVVSCLAGMLSCRNAFQNGTDGGSETGGSCPDGSAGCPCYGNASCDGTLECVEGLCLDPDCTDGTLDCPCYPNSTCLEGLTCVQSGVCKDGGSGESGTGTTTDETGTETSTTDASTSTDTATSTSSSTDGTTTGTTDTSTSSSSSDEGVSLVMKPDVGMGVN